MYASTGAVLAVGLRHAGSGHAAAAGLLRRRLMTLLQLQATLPERGPRFLSRLHVEECVSVTALCLGAVMAGSGHAGTLGALRALSLRSAPRGAASGQPPPGEAHAPASSLTYGSHLAVGMALGFLFLGMGRLGFSTKPSAVAALLVSMLPPFPLSSTDQRGHHQASGARESV